MKEKITPKMQHALIQLQQYQQQAQVIAMQKQQLEMQLAELEAALEELKNSKEKSVFKSVGPVLVKIGTADMKAELAENVETTNVRIKSVSKQDELLKSKMKELSSQFSEMNPAG